ncbi:MAG: S8 family serine peptidase [Candidatus Zixiibacteriota bacterium]
MKRFPGALAYGIIIVCFLISGTVSAVSSDHLPYMPGRVVILTEPKYTPTLKTILPDIPFADLKSYDEFFLKALKDTYPIRTKADKSASRSPIEDLYILTFPDTVEVAGIVSRITGQPGIRYVEPDYKLEFYDMPTDSLFEHQWYLNNTGQGYWAVITVNGYDNDTLRLDYGTPGEDINIRPIYENTPADAVEVILAVIDTGVDYDHPDLTDNIAFNLNEIPGNGIDDDHNGFVDDVVGWDFSGNHFDIYNIVGDNDPMDDSVGHGTHVAGCAAAVINDVGVAGYPGNIKILPVKIFPNAVQSVSVPAILYAIEMGAKVINMSWGSPYEMDIVRTALVYARERGCLPVAAAGNSGNSVPNIPAALDETFTVGGTNSRGYLTTFTTYGPFIDIVAPARDILSLRADGTDLYDEIEPGLHIIDEKYIIANGTSMASPIVAGAAAMLMSFNPTLDIDRISDVLRQSAKDITDPWNEGEYLPGYDTLSGWGRLDVAAAFDLLQAPSAYIASPVNQQIDSGIIDIRIGVTGEYNGPSSLSIGEGKVPEEWTLLYETDATAAGGVYYSWDSEGKIGYFTLKLETDNGFNLVVIRVVNGELVAITSPAPEDILEYLAPIYGTAYSSNFDSLVLSYRNVDSTSRKRLMKQQAIYLNEHFMDWPVGMLTSGEYYLYLDVYDGDTMLSDTVHTFIDNNMKSGFPISFSGFTAISPAVGDIDGDGIKEIVVGTSKGVYAYKPDGSLLPGFPAHTDKDLRTIAAFDDIDGDGLLDIIISGDNILTCLNYRGETIPGWPNNASTGMTYVNFPIPVATRLYEESDSVVLYMSRQGEVNAYRYSGDSYFYSLNGLFTALDPNIFDTANTSGLATPFVTVADLEPDGELDVVSIYGAALDESGVYIWDSRNGLAQDGWDTPQARNVSRVAGGMLADITGDGSLEIITAGTDSLNHLKIFITRADRQEVPGWPVELPDVYNWIGNAPICVDLDGDDYKEILIGYFNWDIAHIYAFRHDGTSYLDNPPYIPYGLFATVQNTIGHLIVADIDGDGQVNVITRGGHLFPFSTGYEKVFAWNPDGTMTEGFPMITPTAPMGVYPSPICPVIDDIDNDGFVDMIMCGSGDQLFVYGFDAPYNASRMPWPKYMRDAKNSGINPDRRIITDVDDDTDVLPNTFEITDNYPNPFNPSTTIRFALDRATDISLEIYNILGQKVRTVASGRYPAGVFEVNWDGTDKFNDAVASGVYLARLSGNGNQSTRKMMLLR